MKITPTIGRVLWFRPFDQDYDFDKRHAAVIAQVNADGTLNLTVFNDYGVSQAEQNIVLVQGDDKPGYGQAEWMPYQKGQAKSEMIVEATKMEPISEKRIGDNFYEMQLRQEAERVEAADQKHSEDDVPPCNNEGDDLIIENADESESSDEGLDLKSLIPVKILEIAMACHEANRSYCESIDDDSQVAWEDAPDWQKESAVKGVRNVVDNMETIKPEDSHNSWLAEKEADGWVYGEEKDVEAKTHPCFVPYDELPEGQRYKYELFIATVRGCLAEIEEK